MLKYWDDLYRISWDELRHEYMKIADELEMKEKENKELKEKISELKDKVGHYEEEIMIFKQERFRIERELVNRIDEIDALKHMLDRKDEEK